jgi:Family of unknown function (DUF6807)
MKFRFVLTGVILIGLVTFFATEVNAELTAKKSADGEKVTIEIDGAPFAEYLTVSGAKPIVYPIIGPTGSAMTRAYPIEKARPDERDDHIHHRSLWFTHGTVIKDGEKTNFWHEKEYDKKIKNEIDRKTVKERTVHREFTRIESGPQAVVETINDWMSGDKKILEDKRTYTFGADGANRWIDLDITLFASAGEVTFGDDKEGCMGIRMASPLKPDAKKGGVLTNSHGETNKKAWGHAAAWVDYSGKLDGKPVGITMMNHPKSFRYPTYWHARTYGLCSANPFGVSFFDSKDKNGSFTLPAGGSITFYYRVLFHSGGLNESNPKAQFEKYAKEKK